MSRRLPKNSKTHLSASDALLTQSNLSESRTATHLGWDCAQTVRWINNQRSFGPAFVKHLTQIISAKNLSANDIMQCRSDMLQDLLDYPDSTSLQSLKEKLLDEASTPKSHHWTSVS